MTKFIKSVVMVLVCALILPGYKSPAVERLGYTIVKDGDTIQIDKINIRLYGIDAPETKQLCYDSNSTPWKCGMAAKEFLNQLINEQEVKCTVHRIDIYKREVATCYVDDIDINKAMVENGYAVAYRYYSKQYSTDEIKAKKQFLGIWKTAFMEPEQWRRYNKHLQKMKKTS
jgi:endonuclease YncB( thermonuclease family)